MIGRMKSLIGLLALGTVLTVSSSVTALAQGGGGTSRQWAVIIAAQDYRNPNVPRLTFTLNDAENLRQTLENRAGIPDGQILMMTDKSPADLQPTAQNLKTRVKQFIQNVGPNDKLTIYFSGHGHVLGEQTVLVPLDFDGESADKAWPTADVRAILTACPSRTKFLILDCCHAGGAGGKDLDVKDDETQRKIISGFKPGKDDDYLLLASCSADQKSWEWQVRRQSFFTFWLCRALEGGSDTNGDGEITADEVFNYTRDRTMKSVEQVYNRQVEQQPARAIPPRVGGNPVLLVLRPEDRDSLCRRLAYHLDLDIRANSLNKVAVRAFSDLRSRQDPLAGANATVNFAQSVRDALAVLSRAQPSYTVVPELASGFGTTTKEDSGTFRARSKKLGIDALVDGSLRIRDANHALGVECRLTDSSGTELVNPSGVMRMSVETYADTGHSFTLASLRRSAPAREPAPRIAKALGGPRFDPVKLDEIANQEDGKHPLDPSNPNRLPFDVSIWSLTQNKYKVPRFEGSSMIVGAQRNEQFQIHVKNPTGDFVAVRLFVDGINTKGMDREEMDRARYWLLKPGPTTRFDGWVDFQKQGKFLLQQRGNRRFDPVSEVPAQPRSVNMIFKQFQFADVSESVAGRQGFYDQIGVITAVFYGRQGKGGLGVAAGEDVVEQIDVENFILGECLGAVNVKYVEDQDLLANAGGL